MLAYGGGMELNRVSGRSSLGTLSLAAVLAFGAASASAYILEGAQQGKVLLNGREVPISLSKGNFMQGQMYDLAEIGEWQFQVNPYFSIAPAIFYLSGGTADATVIDLGMTSADKIPGSLPAEHKENIAAMIKALADALRAGDLVAIHALMGRIDNIEELRCSADSPVFIQLFIKNGRDSADVKESFANCTTLAATP